MVLSHSNRCLRLASPSRHHGRSYDSEPGKLPSATLWRDVHHLVEELPGCVQVAFAVRCLERAAEFANPGDMGAIDHAISLARGYARGLEQEAQPMSNADSKRSSYQPGNRVYSAALWLVEAILAEGSAGTTTFVKSSIASAIGAAGAAAHSDQAELTPWMVYGQVRRDLNSLTSLRQRRDWSGSTAMDPDELGPLWEESGFQAV